VRSRRCTRLVLRVVGSQLSVARLAGVVRFVGTFIVPADRQEQMARGNGGTAPDATQPGTRPDSRDRCQRTRDGETSVVAGHYGISSPDGREPENESQCEPQNELENDPQREPHNEPSSQHPGGLQGTSQDQGHRSKAIGKPWGSCPTTSNTVQQPGRHIGRCAQQLRTQQTTSVRQRCARTVECDAVPAAPRHRALETRSGYSLWPIISASRRSCSARSVLSKSRTCTGLGSIRQ
jgi:hypothetical protein